MIIYLTGQNNFGNRGCEALVRSTVLAVRAVLPDAEFLVPSLDPERDGAQWPQHERPGVRLVPAPTGNWWLHKWGAVCDRLGWLAAGPWPGLARDSLDGQYITQADLVLSIGGDNLSLDYGVGSLAYFVAVAELAMSLGKPVALWGASVGPFSRLPAVERHMAAHLRRLGLVGARESRTVEYLARIGVRDNVVAVVDTAFLLQPQPLALEPFWPAMPGDGVLGLNISALIAEVRAAANGRDDLLSEVVSFITRVLRDTGLSVLLVPHVAPLGGGPRNSDEVMNQRILQALKGLDTQRIGVVPSGLNAAQLKYVISQCRYLVAARTHATIAAFSTGVPTVSIAYSVKAEGINEDLFDHLRYVLKTPEVSAASLWASLDRLRNDEPALARLYRERLDGWRDRANWGARRLPDLLGRAAESGLAKAH